MRHDAVGLIVIGLCGIVWMGGATVAGEPVRASHRRAVWKQAPTKATQPWPWRQVGAYSSVDAWLLDDGMLEAWWSRKTVVQGSGGTPQQVVYRCTDACGRVAKIEVHDGEGKTLRSATFDYDACGRLATLTVGPTPASRTTKYQYDASGQLLQESIDVLRPDSSHLRIEVVYTRKAEGLQVRVTEDGALHDEVTFDGAGRERDRKTYQPDGQLSWHHLCEVDAQDRIVKDTTRTFGKLDAKEPYRELEVVQETRRYDPQTGACTTLEGTKRQWMDFDRQVHLTETHFTQYEADGVSPRSEKAEYYGLWGDPPQLQITVTSTTERKYDSQRRLTEETEIVKDRNRAVEERAKRRYLLLSDGRVQTVLTDVGIDGTDDTEQTSVCDSADRLIESREGKPGGPWDRRTLYRYNAQGDLVRRELYEQQAPVPTTVWTFE